MIDCLRILKSSVSTGEVFVVLNSCVKLQYVYMMLNLSCLIIWLHKNKDDLLEDSVLQQPVTMATWSVRTYSLTTVNVKMPFNVGPLSFFLYVPKSPFTVAMLWNLWVFERSVNGTQLETYCHICKKVLYNAYISVMFQCLALIAIGQ